MSRTTLEVGGVCSNGHTVTEDVAYIYPSTARLAGKVVCKICRMNWQRTRKGQPLQDFIGPWNRNKTHCALGHEYSQENTQRLPNGSRKCRICSRLTMRRLVTGITPSGFGELWDSQDHACAICASQFATTTDAHVDHDHATGAIRGLLCNNCNNGLGRFRDKPEVLQAAIEYLARHAS